MMFPKRTTALAVIVIAALGLVTLGTGQSKKSRRAKSKKAVANANVVPQPTPALPTAPAEPEAHKKNERISSPVPETAAAGAAPAGVPDSPRYTYEFTQPAAINNRILIEHDGNGKGKITFERRSLPAPVTDPLELSPAAWIRIKGHWDALNFLDSQQEYQTERQYPQIGTVTLKLQSGAKQRTAAFNWTHDKEASALADEYRRAADQAMLVFDIAYARETEPLSAPDTMRRFETMLGRNGFSDVKQLTPLLQDLSVDERVPLIARNHAARLLKKIQK